MIVLIVNIVKFVLEIESAAVGRQPAMASSSLQSSSLDGGLSVHIHTFPDQIALKLVASRICDLGYLLTTIYVVSIGDHAPKKETSQGIRLENLTTPLLRHG